MWVGITDIEVDPSNSQRIWGYLQWVLEREPCGLFSRRRQYLAESFLKDCRGSRSIPLSTRKVRTMFCTPEGMSESSAGTSSWATGSAGATTYPSSSSPTWRSTTAPENSGPRPSAVVFGKWISLTQLLPARAAVRHPSIVGFGPDYS